MRNLYVRDLKVGMTRWEVMKVWGEPDLTSTPTRKYKLPLMYKYGPVEVIFCGDKLATVWCRNNNDELVYLLGY